MNIQRGEPFLYLCVHGKRQRIEGLRKIFEDLFEFGDSAQKTKAVYEL